MSGRRWSPWPRNVAVGRDKCPDVSRRHLERELEHTWASGDCAQLQSSLPLALQLWQPLTWTVQVCLIPSLSPWQSQFIEFQNKLIFSATEPTNGRELWQWDGTNSPTLVHDINSGASHSNPVSCCVPHPSSIREIGCLWRNELSSVTQENFFLFQNKLIFMATTPSYGKEMWQWDGVNVPTLIADINPGTSGSNVVRDPSRWPHSASRRANTGGLMRWLTTCILWRSVSTKLYFRISWCLLHTLIQLVTRCITGTEPTLLL